MTRMTERRRTMVSASLALATMALAVGTALAHGGYGPGPRAGCAGGEPPACAQDGAPGCGAGMGCGAGYGPGMRHGMGYGMGPGMQRGIGPGPRHGMAGYGPGRTSALLTDEERTAHRAKMQSLASVDECRAYVAEFSQQLQAKAKDQGVTVGGPNAAMCDRMQAHGRFKQ